MNISTDAPEPSGGSKPPVQGQRTQAQQQQVSPQGGPQQQQQGGQQRQPKQDGFAQPQQSNKRKIIFTVLLVVAALVLVALIVTGIKAKISGNSSAKIVQTSTVVPAITGGSNTVVAEPTTAAGVVLSKATTDDLIVEVQRLTDANAALATKAATPAPIPGAPAGVTSIGDWTKAPPPVLQESTESEYKELVPYERTYTQLPDGSYMFSVRVQYGDTQYFLPVTYKDYSILKDKGVIVIKIELSTQIDSTGTASSRVTYVAVHPDWQYLTTLQ